MANGIKGKSLLYLTRADIEEWISEDIERINWYVQVSSKKYERKVYPKKKIINENGKEVSVNDTTQPYTTKMVDMAIGDLKAELIERFPELGYGSSKDKTSTESHAAAAARLLAAYNAKKK